MVDKAERWRDYARIALAGIRLFNGAAGLFAPAALFRRLGGDPDASPGALYAFRLFGVRTIVIAGELLLPDGEIRAHALRVAPVIHASDVTAALLLATRGHLPPRQAVAVVLISAINTVLSLIAQPRKGPGAG